jgi:hypothetical protein
MRRALLEGPIVREVLMVGWVIRERVSRGEGGEGRREEGVDARDLVAHAVGML